MNDFIIFVLTVVFILLLNRKNEFRSFFAKEDLRVSSISQTPSNSIEIINFLTIFIDDLPAGDVAGVTLIEYLREIDVYAH